MYLQFQSVKEPSKNHDIWIRVRVRFVLAGFGFFSISNKLCGRPPQYAPAPCDFDLWPFDLESGVRARGLPLCQL